MKNPEAQKHKAHITIKQQNLDSSQSQSNSEHILLKTGRLRRKLKYLPYGKILPNVHNPLGNSPGRSPCQAPGDLHPLMSSGHILTPPPAPSPAHVSDHRTSPRPCVGPSAPSAPGRNTHHADVTTLSA